MPSSSAFSQIQLELKYLQYGRSGAGRQGGVARLQVYQCVDHQYNIIDCASVCHVHDCQPPEARQQCGDSLLYKTVRVQAGGQHKCRNAVCQQKSGTCTRNSLHDMTLTS